MDIKLEKLGLKFAKDIAAALNDSRIRDNLRDLPCPYTVAHAREFISGMLSDTDVNFVFAITADGKFAGCISATRQQNIHSRTAEVGYYVIPDLWGSGIATRALKQLCNFIFETTDIIRLYAEPFARNPASCRVLENAGFYLEGTLRQNAIKCGVVEDMKIFSFCKNHDLNL